MSTQSREFSTVFYGMHKESLRIADHFGWYLLDGRPLGVLLQPAQNRALALGYAGVLPDLLNRTLIDGPAYATVGGIAAPVLVQANLPPFNITGQLATVNNNHGHSIANATGIGHAGGALSWRSGFPQTGPQVQPRDITASGDAPHSHTFNVPSGGSNAPLNIEAEYLGVRFFVFLGA